MKKILLIHHQASMATKDKAARFAAQVEHLISNDIQVVSTDIEDIAFEVSSESARVYNVQHGFDVREFDMVVFRHVSRFVEEARATAIYCEKLGIKYIDSYINRPVLDKVSASFLHWSKGLPVPRTLFGATEEQIRMLPEFGEKAIYKDNHGYKGELNFLVESGDEIKKIAEDNQASRFLLQEFIPNEGDLRVLILNFRPALVIGRVGDGSSHLSNTSQGGDARIVPLNEVTSAILDDCVSAARVEKLEVAGVDIIIDSRNGQHYILEVNQAPQISSGSFIEEKTEKYVEMLEEIMLDKKVQL
jgi:glutathione synthase/RimK-type ligase-like ATP-grasp enzyme